MCASLRVSLPRCDYTPTDLPAPSQQQQKINKPHNFLSHFNHITLPNRMLAINRWCLLLFIWLFVFSKWWMKRLAATIARQRNKNSFCACVYINTYIYTYISICTAQDLFYNLSSAMYKIIVCSVSYSGSRSKFPRRPSAVQHVALLQRGWLPSRLDKIFTGVKRCIFLIQCEILLLSALFPISLFTMGWERVGERERQRVRERQRERIQEASCLVFWLCILKGAEA